MIAAAIHVDHELMDPAENERESDGYDGEEKYNLSSNGITMIIFVSLCNTKLNRVVGGNIGTCIIIVRI